LLVTGVVACLRQAVTPFKPEPRARTADPRETTREGVVAHEVTAALRARDYTRRRLALSL
ncbi:MAG: hypothetical protein WEB00_04340, partial [Dehalococcoidia bacterium]